MCMCFKVQYHIISIERVFKKKKSVVLLTDLRVMSYDVLLQERLNNKLQRWTTKSLCYLLFLLLVISVRIGAVV